jgi:hypothetical protein
MTKEALIEKQKERIPAPIEVELGSVTVQPFSEDQDAITAGLLADVRRDQHKLNQQQLTVLKVCEDLLKELRKLTWTLQAMRSELPTQSTCEGKCAETCKGNGQCHSQE